MENHLVHLQDFPKSERLCSQKLIKELFSKGSSLFLYPFKILYLPHSPSQDELPTEKITFPKILISVSKKNFKRAVDRNKIKRQCREIYRLAKHPLFSQKTAPQVLAVIFVAQKHEKFDFMKKRLEKVLGQLP